MATLTIRNLPDAVRDKLRVRAAQNGRSMEAEARHVLEGAVENAEDQLGEDEIAKRVAEIQQELRNYIPEGRSLVDEFLAERRRMWGEE